MLTAVVLCVATAWWTPRFLAKTKWGRLYLLSLIGTSRLDDIAEARRKKKDKNKDKDVN